MKCSGRLNHPSSIPAMTYRAQIFEYKGNWIYMQQPFLYEVNIFIACLISYCMFVYYELVKNMHACIARYEQHPFFIHWKSPHKEKIVTPWTKFEYNSRVYWRRTKPEWTILFKSLPLASFKLSVLLTVVRWSISIGVFSYV